MIDPEIGAGPMAHQDLPDDCRRTYDEALSISSRSPRGAAALLRLCVQTLIPHLGEPEANLDKAIGNLVQQGLPPLVQMALDYCRVIGNNAVHPGAIQVDDSPEIVAELFRLINFIVDDRITRPKQITKLYESLPAGARQAIDRRDKKGE